MKTKHLIVTLVGSALLAASPWLRAADGPYHFIKEIHVGGDGRWDYLSVDAQDRRLFVAHGTDVVVIDLDKDEVVGRIGDTPGVHGFVAVPELGRGFSSNGGEAKASIVDLKTLKTIQKVNTGQNPDAILYDPAKKEVYTFNGRSQSATVFEAETGKVVATIPLSGKPETGVVDPEANRVYVNLENKSTLAVIDTEKHEVVATWPIAPGEEATGLAFDAAHKRLFLGCGGNQLLEMIDSTSGKVLGSVPAGDGIDAAAFDPATQLAFASAGEGNVAIAHEDSPDKLTLVQTLATEPRARTMAVDPTTHRIYLACAKFEPPAAGTTGSKPRPKAVPDSFKILVYGTDGK